MKRGAGQDINPTPAKLARVEEIVIDTNLSLEEWLPNLTVLVRHPHAFMTIWNRDKSLIAQEVKIDLKTLTDTTFASLIKMQTLSKKVLEALLTPITSGEDEGKSALWFLAQDHLAFYAVWDHYQDEIPVNALVAQANAGNDEGISTLWLLAKNPETFLAVWNKYGDKIPLNDLLTQAKTGADEGISVFWLLADLLKKGHPKAFQAVWNKYGDKIPLSAFLTQAKGLQAGSSVLSLLKYPSENEQTEVFLAVLKKYGDKIPVNDLLGDDEDVWLPYHARSYPQVFMTVWDTYGDNIPLNILLAKAQQGNAKGLSMLWLAAYAAQKGHPQAFMAIWNRYQNQISVADILTRNDNEGAVLDLLFKNTEAFLGVWERFKDEIPLEALLVKTQDGKSILSKLVKWRLSASKTEEVAVLLVRDILLTKPGVLPRMDDMLRALFDNESYEIECSIKEIPATSLLNEDIADALGLDFDVPLVKLINARNAFFKLLDKMKKNEILADSDVEKLQTLASKAQQYGYLNAYYDVGHFFESRNEVFLGHQAYELISPHSPQYQKMAHKCAEHRYALATSTPVRTVRDKHLRCSFKWTQRVPDRAARSELLRKIGNCYILGETTFAERESVISNEIISFIDKGDVSACFSVFDEIKMVRKQEKKINALKEELARSNNYLPHFNRVATIEVDDISNKLNLNRPV